MLLSISIPHCSLPPKTPLPHPPVPTRHVPLILSKTTLHLPKATSLSGSAADFPEQVAGKRRRSVAGVDQDELVDPAELADPDSSFLVLNGVKIHYKITHHREIEDAQSSTGLPMILLHGFGASVFSWDRAMKPLARVTGSKVVAFDRPAFGLTSRVEQAMALNPYSMAFSVMATVNFIDMLGAGKAILMGHSAGCLVAVNTYFEAPEKVAALILVAPAIFAPLVRKKGEISWSLWSLFVILKIKQDGVTMNDARIKYDIYSLCHRWGHRSTQFHRLPQAENRMHAQHIMFLGSPCSFYTHEEGKKVYTFYNDCDGPRPPIREPGRPRKRRVPIKRKVPVRPLGSDVELNVYVHDLLANITEPLLPVAFHTKTAHWIDANFLG